MIHTHFKPYQPSIALGNQPLVTYEETKVISELQNYIYCYWQLKTTEPLDDPFLYRVVSDGCIDILFEQSNQDQIFITGFSTKYLEYDLSYSFDYIGIRFLPIGFPILFDIPANTLTNQLLPLSEVKPFLNTILNERLAHKLDLEQAKKLFDSAFTGFLDQRITPPEVDHRFENAVNQILEARGHLNVSELNVGVSERQLRRLFGYYFGESAKTFARIIRFQNILGSKPSSQSLKNNKIYFDEGYYDQAHFIKEFKEFYGVTPNRAFGP